MSNIKVKDAVMFRRAGPREVYIVTSTDAGSDGDLIALVDEDGRDAGLYSRQEIMRVPTPSAERIKELEAQVKRMRKTYDPLVSALRDALDWIDRREEGTEEDAAFESWEDANPHVRKALENAEGIK
jgi:hypothetical protein